VGILALAAVHCGLCATCLSVTVLTLFRPVPASTAIRTMPKPLVTQISAYAGYKHFQPAYISDRRSDANHFFRRQGMFRYPPKLPDLLAQGPDQ
jgi:hypothetical protein